MSLLEVIIVFGGIFALFGAMFWFLWQSLYKWVVFRERYYALYHLKKFDEALKIRGSSFENLDAFEKKLTLTFKRPSSELAKIDKSFEESKEQFEELQKKPKK